ncbi:MAG: hypothetical protein A3H02_01290 [Candidatus Niyogibacteria bacterium RIFCSPLOWO2_12_FULL_41_13]|uniref:Uncharacterized protein n=1 Tax=Candidatus Niyogibacteria bacterium RIFCSPLOWO2_12_FULL_41_13 TaxID=1801726 RepID=A0A1G2F0T6_9BACT|nr:MAG: hypothetical protein A3H02_01290 [Candidatus Niyogibacteria bacterium RIFCSPLOWO2_12_FULL_41_13]
MGKNNKMIKPINITPLNTSKELIFECKKCKLHGIMHLENSIINTDSEANPLRPLDFDCPQCKEKL